MGQKVGGIVLEKSLRADFLKSFNNGEDPSEIMPLIMVTQSSSDKEKYGWLGQVSGLVEWKDERKLRGLLDFDYEILNKSYESTLQVDRDTLDDDQLGAIRLRVQDLAKKARIHVRKLFFDALVDGTTELCYDGLPFFSASHEEGESGVQSNIETQTGATVALFSADFESARTKMRSFKDDKGEPYNEGSLDLYVVASPAMESVIDKVLSAELIDSATNTLKGAAKKIISGRLSGNNWYLSDASGSMKPMIKQERKNPEFGALEKDSERGFMSKRYLYGIDYRVGFGYGLWQKMVKVA